MNITVEYFLAIGLRDTRFCGKGPDQYFNPGGREGVAWCVVCKEREDVCHKKIYGKWLVFNDYDKISETWKAIVMAIKENKLEKCRHAKSSTLFYNPVCAGPGPSTSGVICVYTCKDDMDDIGYKLIQLVKQDIKYKTDEDTLNYKYAHVGARSTIKTLYYNHGSPSFELIGEQCFGTTQNKEDIWHVNEVVNSDIKEVSADYGRWILTLEYTELTHLWHVLKRKVLNGEIKAWKMVCPPKRRKSSPYEKPVFHVYTSQENERNVGSDLILEVRRNIKFERKEGYPQYRTLFWNEGDYYYQRSPSVQIVGEHCSGTTHNELDMWYGNEVVNSEMKELSDDYGRWILTLKYTELTRLWHLLKRKILNGEIKAWKMACPTKQRKSLRDEKAVLHVYTSQENERIVGSDLILEVRRNISFERKEGYPQYRTLLWNDVEHHYEKINRKGITKNWRTGEDI